MRKDNLCTGDIVTLRNGNKHTVMLGMRKFGDCTVSCEDITSWNDLKNYNKNLKSKYEEFDIVRVERPKHPYTSMGISGYEKYVKLIWEREETKKMTVKEIQEELGYKIEIVE
jgi:hypothetical protein